MLSVLVVVVVAAVTFMAAVALVVFLGVGLLQTQLA
jgi:hypothetical protein